MPQEIKLMADYGCWPLWWSGDHEPGNIDPVSLPLHPQTRTRLNQWAETYDAMLNWNDPGATPDPTDEEIDAFEQEGVSLWKQLASELAPDYKVVYYSVRLNTVVKELEEI